MYISVSPSSYVYCTHTRDTNKKRRYLHCLFSNLRYEQLVFVHFFLEDESSEAAADPALPEPCAEIPGVEGGATGWCLRAGEKGGVCERRVEIDRTIDRKMEK